MSRARAWALATGLVVVVVALGLVLVPRLGGFPVSRAQDWLATVAGVFTGAAAATVMEAPLRRARRPTPAR